METVDIYVPVVWNELIRYFALRCKFSMPVRFDGLKVRVNLCGAITAWVGASLFQGIPVVLGSLCHYYVDKTARCRAGLGWMLWTRFRGGRNFAVRNQSRRVVVRLWLTCNVCLYDWPEADCDPLNDGYSHRKSALHGSVIILHLCPESVFEAFSRNKRRRFGYID